MRPAAFGIGRVRVRVHSGPRSPDGRWYWKADVAIDRTHRTWVWRGWATEAEAIAAVLHDPTAQAAMGPVGAVLAELLVGGDLRR